MVNNNPDSISIIKNIVCRFIPDSKIILFGSRARSDNNQDSDYDFLIVTKNSIEIQEKRDLKSIIRKELARFKIPADILIQSEDEISYKKEITGHILRHVIKEGVLI